MSLFTSQKKFLKYKIVFEAQIIASLHPSALLWFKSNLTDHFQSIKIGSVLSNACKLLYTVPQGNLLGPNLLPLYTTPLASVIVNHQGIKFHFYADDIQLYLTHIN